MKTSCDKNKGLLHENWNKTKIFFLSLFIMSVSGCNFNSNKSVSFKIDLWDYHYSLAYSIQYHFDNKEMFIVKIGNLAKEQPDTILFKKVNASENDKIIFFLNSFPFESLKDEYRNQIIEDGDQKKVNICFKDKCKSIIISNIYQENIGELINMLNQSLKDDYKIKYRK
ncbi:MAG: hypothetical protein ACOYM0_09515 [Bacteroidales bacterium]